MTDQPSTPRPLTVPEASAYDAAPHAWWCPSCEKGEQAYPTREAVEVAWRAHEVSEHGAPADDGRDQPLHPSYDEATDTLSVHSPTTGWVISATPDQWVQSWRLRTAHGDPALTSARLAALSRWIDGSYGEGRAAEAVDWRRLQKMAQEVGEAFEAYAGFLGENPRKGRTHAPDDVLAEILDVAVAALGAYEHFTSNNGRSMLALAEHVRALIERGAAHGLHDPQPIP